MKKTQQTYIYIMDRLINKPIRLSIDKKLEIKYGQKILYKKEKTDKDLSLWIVLWYPVETDKEGILIRPLSPLDKKNLQQREEKAKDLFKIFKKEFKKEFEEAVPVNARMSRGGKMVYFYFFAETRFNFSQFVKDFRQKIKINFFLYQVGARERVRLSPASSYRECPTCGKGQLCCTMYKHPLPSVETETIITQNLEARWVENLKGFCGKLKCCLNFEQETYEELLKNYPLKGDEFEYDWEKYICLSNNVFTWEVTAKHTQSGEISRILLNQPLAQCSTCNLQKS